MDFRQMLILYQIAPLNDIIWNKTNTSKKMPMILLAKVAYMIRLQQVNLYKPGADWYHNISSLLEHENEGPKM